MQDKIQIGAEVRVKRTSKTLFPKDVVYILKKQTGQNLALIQKGVSLDSPREQKTPFYLINVPSTEVEIFSKDVDNEKEVLELVELYKTKSSLYLKALKSSKTITVNQLKAIEKIENERS